MDTNRRGNRNRARPAERAFESMRLSNYTVDDVDTIRQLVLSRPGRRREFSDSIDREVCPAVHQPVGILRARQRVERVGRVALPRCHQYGGAGSGD